MSIFASILRSVYKLSGAKKAFALPEDALRKEIEKQNRHRGVFTPTDRKAYYETIAVNGFPCLIVREHPKPSERAILYFFGGGMVIGPDKGDLPVMRKLCRETGCDVWFPFYPLCMEHCITETYAMVYEMLSKNDYAVRRRKCQYLRLFLRRCAGAWHCGAQQCAVRAAAAAKAYRRRIPPARCRGTMRKGRGCRHSINGTFPSTMPLW